MKTEFYMNFPDGLPIGTAQHKGERVIMQHGHPVIVHYKKKNVVQARKMFEAELLPNRPKQPLTGAIRIFVCVYFDVKSSNLWGKYKTTRPDADNYCKELFDAMESCGFFLSDAQIVDVRIVKRYAEQGSIYIKLEGIE